MKHIVTHISILVYELCKYIIGMVIIRKCCGQTVKEITTEQFAKQILENPGRIFSFFIDPDSNVFFHLASVDIFHSQTIIINAARFITDTSVASEPGATYAFSIMCYDVHLNMCCTWDECLDEVIEGLEGFKCEFDNTDPMWYVVTDGERNKLEVIHHWDMGADQ